MTAFALTLDRVTFTLPDGRVLFPELSASFDTTPTGLVGSNGVGKSMLGRLLAGQLLPSSGHIQRQGHVHLLAQHSGVVPGRIADLAGVAPVLDALDRIEAGSVDPHDFALIGERWTLREQLQAQWRQLGLPDLDPAAPASLLSGGQAMQVALAGALLSDADALVLDEPSNHLDSAHRTRLIDALAQWRGGLIVISHDRALLREMQRIVELTPTGLRSYGGNYDLYAEQKQAERANAEAELALRKRERRHEQAALREQHERQEHRQSRAQRDARNANQAPILLGGMKNRAENSAGRLQAQQLERRAEADSRVREAAAGVDDVTRIAMLGPCLATPGPQQVATLADVQLPWVEAPWQDITLHLQRGDRIGVRGRNGSGKSTLLRVLAGEVQALKGEVKRAATTALLDQTLSSLPAEDSALQLLQRANPQASDATLRTQLALLGLDAERSLRPLATLSGGERVKAALAAVLYAEAPPQLLLLDEPGNHLDLASLAALLQMLNQYRGSVVIVSHDQALLDAVQLTHLLDATAKGWELQRL
ncbi:ABC-F family ATP-binding cassette domain-containing protein [Stenotrophomonas sp. ISL-67]|uniref:ATP-binding cassette domain-containing protein n=1 Tax=Stenotrophomonas sp. ISL-67 TaxID=2819171 RepID=UPI001BEB2544|nr:ATP-binding cassette domain-containing protein [Stenotrophomonas sp. ISL-67]MBT2768054.1 ABC-F family ATP-binding cassette domain-containing protein [Stenotrophomonas sp. ISL-67]